ncbi:MAG: hypothetical protein NT009_08270 [Proteobacteria bacterium]|nr:hypothetical protein [Pseudomonadota bacterium]
MEKQNDAMDPVMAGCLSQMELGKPQGFESLTIIPLFSPNGHSPKYLTLKEALEKNLLTIQEVSEGGSVPQLKATNLADLPVLILAGEELAGAKQNRVLNTTILLRVKSETIIPVSCTEQGRWSYVSNQFRDSGVVMSPRLRSAAHCAVACSLANSQEYRTDQGEIWSGIREFSERAGVNSTTGAMRDVYESKTNDLAKYLEAFPPLPRQKGLIAIFNGEVAGLDYISLESAYATLHQKLAKSYAMDAILLEKKKKTKPSVAGARAFLQGLKQSKVKKYKSIGHGWDHRYEGKGFVGSALVYQKQAIHTVFFKTQAQELGPRMAGFRRRMDFIYDR